jgi:hypothetical protein
MAEKNNWTEIELKILDFRVIELLTGNATSC